MQVTDYIMARRSVCVARNVHDANIGEKTRKSNVNFPHDKSENHKNIHCQLQYNGIAILVNSKEKSEHFFKKQLPCLEFVLKISKTDITK